MPLLFLSIFASSLIYLLWRRVLDLWTVFLGLTLIYFVPGVTGEVFYHARGNGFMIPIAVGTYGVMALVLVLLTSGVIAYDFISRTGSSAWSRSASHEMKRSPAWRGRWVLMPIAIGAAVYVNAKVGSIGGTVDKSDLVDSLNQVYILFATLSPVVLAASLLTRFWVGVVVGFGLLILDAYLGYRSGLPSAIGGFLICFFYKKQLTLWNVFAVILLALLLFVAVAVYKQVAWAVFAGRWDVVQHNFDGGVDFVWSSLMSIESFGVQGTLNEVVVTGVSFKVPLLSVYVGMLVPFVGHIIIPPGEVANYFSGDALFNVDYGVAGNTWAEFYSYGGYVGVVLWAAFMAFFVCLCQVFFARMSFWSRACFAVFFIGFVITVNRSCSWQCVEAIKRMLVVWLVGLACERGFSRKLMRQDSPDSKSVSGPVSR